MGRKKRRGDGKRSKKGMYAMLAAVLGGVFFFLKKRKGNDDTGWEEADPGA